MHLGETFNTCIYLISITVFWVGTWRDSWFLLVSCMHLMLNVDLKVSAPLQSGLFLFVVESRGLQSLHWRWCTAASYQSGRLFHCSEARFVDMILHWRTAALSDDCKHLKQVCLRHPKQLL